MIPIRSNMHILCLIRLIECHMVPFVVGGMKAKIKHFPHSVFLNFYCADVYNGEVIPWICGSSVLNEKILLTAAHCLEDCSGQGFISANFGHKHKDKGSMSTIVKFVVHEKYDKFTTANDIALVRPKTPLMLNRNTKRVAIMKNPPYYEKAQIAGWGVINDIKDKHTSVLHFVDQYVWHSRKCVKTIKSLALGGLCASSRHADSYSSR